MAIAGQVGALTLLGRAPTRAGRSCSRCSWLRLCGMFNGTLVVRYGVQPIIATLILFIAGRGIAQLLSGGQLTGFRNPGLPVPRSGPDRRHPDAGGADAPGRRGAVVRGALHRLRAHPAGHRRQRGRGPAGRGPDRAGQDGRLRRLSALAGLVGLVVIGITAASDANNVGLGIELDAIAAVAVSGTPLTGGRISVVGTLSAR